MKSFTKIQNEKDITNKYYVDSQTSSLEEKHTTLEEKVDNISNRLGTVAYTSYTPEGGTEGSDYAVDIPGVTEIKKGFTFTMIPHVTNHGKYSLSLFINGVRANMVARRLTTDTASSVSIPDGFVESGWPVSFTYSNGGIWILEVPKTDAEDLLGEVPITNGGTGAETAEAARKNLGAAAEVHTHTTSDITDLSTVVIKQNEKGVASGVATLGTDTKIPVAQLPVIPITNGGTGGTTAATAKSNLGIKDPKRVARFVVGTSTAGWTEEEVDYLCDGVDDQVEINAAIIALPATGGEVIILDGTYNLTASIKMEKNNITLSGVENATILNRGFDGDSSNRGMIYVTQSGITIKNLILEGNKDTYSATGYDYYNNGINCSGYQYGNIAIDNNICRNIGDIGIEVGGYRVSNSRIINNKVLDSKSGIRSSSSDAIVCNNDCERNTEFGIIIDSTESVIKGNLCAQNGKDGIQIYRSGQSIISENICNFNGRYGIGAGELTNEYIYNSMISNNICTGNKSSGIRLNINLTDNVIQGNICSGTTDGNTGYGIYLGYLSATIDRNVISLNNCRDNKYYGIVLYVNNTTTGSCAWNDIIGNICYNNGNTGIDLIGDKNTICGNTCAITNGEYSSTQYSVYITGSLNLITSNNLLGKDCTIATGTNYTGNMVSNNKVTKIT